MPRVHKPSRSQLPDGHWEGKQAEQRGWVAWKPGSLTLGWEEGTSRSFETGLKRPHHTTFIDQVLTLLGLFTGLVIHHGQERFLPHLELTVWGWSMGNITI